ncbi:hypothetical protein JCM33374_g5884 [Metschnikowia sp. JCM 33374]|nr:hypothetical protein JCM33374_g5884 [Metschnikowia sp. JCM 33374]
MSKDPSILPPPNASAPLPVASHKEELRDRPSSIDSKAYSISSMDSSADHTTKFIAFLALGPMTRAMVEDKLQLPKFCRSNEIEHLFATHTQPYLRKDTFTEGDVYPLLSSSRYADITPEKTYLILKDKAYKELRPWQWSAYTDFERELILKNCNHALSRLGFSETHPLRLRIVERSSPARPVKKAATLGGGLLVSSTKKLNPPSNHSQSQSNSQEQVKSGPVSPVILAVSKARASTESPKLNSEARKRYVDKAKKSIGSPLRQEDQSLHSHMNTLVSSSSSDDEKHVRKLSVRKKRHSNESTQSNSSVNSNTNSYTSPSSVNDEAQSDQSDHDSKPSSVVKPPAAASLPTRPSSSFTNHEKKQQYYSQLAEKFRLTYKEYERLHRQLSKDSRKNSHIEKKKSLMKLFELHNTLSEWKRRLWDYHNENNMAEGVMNLSKHRKSNSLGKISASAPSTSKISNTERFGNNNGNPPPRTSDTVRKQALSERTAPPRSKFTLDY